MHDICSRDILILRLIRWLYLKFFTANADVTWFLESAKEKIVSVSIV